MRETGKNGYKSRVIKILEDLFVGCLIVINDPNLRQGIPDILILFGRRWAALEVKASRSAPTRPNQPYYVEQLNKMSYAAIIYPENEEEILYELERALRDQ
jgi:hypothetical protein